MFVFLIVPFDTSATPGQAALVSDGHKFCVPINFACQIKQCGQCYSQVWHPSLLLLDGKANAQYTMYKN